jgi:uncharacterized protein
LIKILVFVLLFSSTCFALEVPRLSGPVIDNGAIISSTMENALESMIRVHYRNKGDQIQVYTIKSLKGEVLEQYSIKVTDKWKVGKAEKDNGILLLIAVKDRKMRIEVGQGLEGKITDLQSGRIIDEMKPYFRAGQYDNGVNFAVSKIIELLGGKASTVHPRRVSNSPVKKSSFNFINLIFILFWSFFHFGMRSRRGHSSFGRSSGWSGGSSSGGWSGGGGGFSGGGSSGSW